MRRQKAGNGKERAGHTRADRVGSDACLNASFVPFATTKIVSRELDARTTARTNKTQHRRGARKGGEGVCKKSEEPDITVRRFERGAASGDWNRDGGFCSRSVSEGKPRRL